MAFLGSTFDATQIEPATPFEVIQPGKYHVQIVNSEMRITKGGSGQYLWLELAIQDGQHANKRLFGRLNLVNQNETAREIAQRTLSAICHATGQMSVSDSEQLHHKSLIANVRVRAEGPDKSGTIRPAANEISGYFPMNGPPAAPAYTGEPMRAQTGAPAEIPAAATVQKKSTPPWQRNSAA